MQSLHSLKCETWNYIESRNSHQELDDEDIEFVEDPNNNQAEKFDVIERALINSEEWFDGATNYDVGKVEWYRECLENLQAHFANINLQDFPSFTSIELEKIFTSLLKSYE